ncbi:hypothetical protein [Flavobacterium aquatile]|uniref:Membrane protein n=1 Tax=Flavobacterium aquatile LMG 4008 = ATCC 11947 TaxID=1453498 RepID=A0A095V3P6_9FLAO|nr:hypothetical protein [Flavobacterium aquatile]KGD69495.1 membrane protein [Flavobacterium aquatile LMG 4008 = ATCC 11947]OXA66050.1 hypothetical protein B0A61_12285 [Flavobacterium aquatile LMG 4008 = ATCC 11947]GEC77527.1 hypothetical protein FAQ01_03970 [Flavobacterium aquatile]
MILIVFKYFTPRGFRGLTFYPFVFLADKDDKLNEVFINHERIHIRQQLELLIVPFYLWYITEYLFRLLQYGDRKKAYYSISFEKEAYTNEKDLAYLKSRSFWRFFRYV